MMHSNLALRLDARTGRARYNRAHRPRWPTGPYLSYRRLMLELNKEFRKILIEEVISAIPSSVLRNDAIWTMGIEDGIRTARERAEELFGADVVSSALQRVFWRLDTQNTNTVRASLGVGATRKHLRRSAFIGEAILARMPNEHELAGYVADNVALIRSIPGKCLDQVGDLVASARLSDIREEDLRKAILERWSVSKSRAELIARDQIGKINARMTESKHAQVGIRRYTWSTSRDERVRDGHEDLEGTVHEYSNPPVVDEATGRRANPGEDYQCRCVAIPYLEAA